MYLVKVIRTSGILAAVTLSVSAAAATSPTSTQSSQSEDGTLKESGLTWWQILLLVIGGFLVFTCWGCYFFFRHRENQQAKFKPVATANGDDPRVRSDSNTVKMEPPIGSPAKSEQGDVEDVPLAYVENAPEVNPDPTRIVPPEEIVIENIDESLQPMASTSDYQQPELRDIPAHARCSGTSRYVAMDDDDDLEYQ